LEVFSGLPAYIHEAILRACIGAAAKHSLRGEDMQPYLEPWLSDEGGDRRCGSRLLARSGKT